MTLEEEAKRNFNSGFNCAESVLLAVSKQTSMTRKSLEAAIPRIATGFGGGIARNGDICGALSGGIMAISLEYGRDRPEQSRDPCYRVVDRFYNEFVEVFGTCRCRKLTGVDVKTKAYTTRIHNERCIPLVLWAARRAHQLIRENQRA